MRTSLIPTAVFVAGLLATAGSVQADLVAEFNFNSAGDLEGWSGNAAAGNVVQGTAISPAGGFGVLTSDDTTGGDPQLFYSTPAISLPAGFLDWDTIEYRIRQLNINDQPVACSGAGVSVLVNALNLTGLTTVVNELNSGWQLITGDISPIPDTFSITSIRIDPVGTPGSIGQNFEIDYVRINGVLIPEPSSLAMFLMGSAAVLSRRKRRR